MTLELARSTTATAAGDADLLIGRMSRRSGLSIKTLRHYDRLGLLPPRDADPVTGYRRYGPEQVETATLIRRLRELEMPLPRVRAVLAAIVYAYETLARAHAVAGDQDEAERYADLAAGARRGIAEDDDGELFDSDLATLPVR
jgi:DNA-binding transcriptional MerR regulator